MAFLRADKTPQNMAAVSGDGVMLRPPRVSDYAEWAELRAAQRVIFTPQHVSLKAKSCFWGFFGESSFFGGPFCSDETKNIETAIFLVGAASEKRFRHFFFASRENLC